MTVNEIGLELSTLSNHLWESANILRGPVDAADFKTYVFPLLFFKRISDVKAAGGAMCASHSAIGKHLLNNGCHDLHGFAGPLAQETARQTIGKAEAGCRATARD